MDSKSPTILVVYYSDTGHTEAAAEALDKALDATVEVLNAPLLAGRHGFWMFCWRAVTALLGRAAAIEPPRRDPGGFDLVVLASPVWAGRLSTPMLGYLEQFPGRIKRVAFVTTQSGNAATEALAQYARLTGLTGVASLTLSDADRRTHHDTKKLADFAEAVKAAIASD